MSFMNEIKNYVCQQFGGDPEDWKCTKDEYKKEFNIKSFKNDNIGENITTISCGDNDIRQLYIQGRPWHFKIVIREFTKDTADIEDLDDVTDYYEIVFYEENNSGDFDWHVAPYLYEFYDLSVSYEEDMENSFTSFHSDFTTLGDVKKDLINNGFIFDGYEEIND